MQVCNQQRKADALDHTELCAHGFLGPSSGHICLQVRASPAPPTPQPPPPPPPPPRGAVAVCLCIKGSFELFINPFFQQGDVFIHTDLSQ